MPVTNIHFEDGVFYCKQEGEISPDDAMRWTHYAEQFAEASAQPIIALIDATDCTFVTAKARAIFARACAMPILDTTAVATSDFKVQQSMQLIAMMARDRQTRIFDTLDEAADFAYMRAASLIEKPAGV